MTNSLERQAPSVSQKLVSQIFNSGYCSGKSLGQQAEDGAKGSVMHIIHGRAYGRQAGNQGGRQAGRAGQGEPMGS